MSDITEVNINGTLYQLRTPADTTYVYNVETSMLIDGTGSSTQISNLTEQGTGRIPEATFVVSPTGEIVSSSYPDVYITWGSDYATTQPIFDGPTCLRYIGIGYDHLKSSSYFRTGIEYEFKQLTNYSTKLYCPELFYENRSLFHISSRPYIFKYKSGSNWNQNGNATIVYEIIAGGYYWEPSPRDVSNVVAFYTPGTTITLT